MFLTKRGTPNKHEARVRPKAEEDLRVIRIDQDGGDISGITKTIARLCFGVASDKTKSKIIWEDGCLRPLSPL